VGGTHSQAAASLLRAVAHGESRAGGAGRASCARQAGGRGALDRGHEAGRREGHAGWAVGGGGEKEVWAV
jgi:hypothetical protein